MKATEQKADFFGKTEMVPSSFLSFIVISTRTNLTALKTFFFFFKFIAFL